MRGRLAVVVCLLLASSCSSPSAPQTPPSQARPPTPTPEEASGKPEQPGVEKDKRSTRPRSPDAKRWVRTEKRSPRAPAPRQREQSGARHRERRPEAMRAYPVAGSYSYEQRGYEEFCQAGTCDRSRLPDAQTLDISYRRRAPNRAVVIADADISQHRSTRTTYRFNRKRVLITQVFARFTYESFDFSSTYVPEPPIRSLVLPLRAGRAWAGRWSDERGGVDGRYRIRVMGKEPVSVGGRRIDAFRLDTRTEFQGEYEGTARIVVWFDPAAKMLVRSQGAMELTSAFGRFATEFQVVLASGPGYPE